MRRITNTDLEILVKSINEATGNPTKPFGTEWNIGNYHISGAYGGVSLHRICGENGGTIDIFRCGHVPKRELYNRMSSFFKGVNHTSTNVVSSMTIAEYCNR